MAIQSVMNNLSKGRIFLFSDKLTPYFYILPSVLFLGVILGFPILFSVIISFQKYDLATLVSKQAQFIGLHYTY
jgi:ABC-type sugar transport system permease subunit